MALQRARRLALLGRLLRSFGSPLTRHPLGGSINVDHISTYVDEPFSRPLRLASHDSLRFSDRPVKVPSSAASLACRADRSDPHTYFKGKESPDV
jgi:hypothetical protein